MNVYSLQNKHILFIIYYMNVYKSAEDYLECILILSKSHQKVRSIDVANYLGFSKPSVSVAVHKLEENEYIVIDNKGCIVLTDKGSEIASKIYDRHVTITKFLTSLGVQENVAKEDACLIEHVISDESFTAIKKSLKK